jgi:predicted transglutaminase-like cysteine proteinase
VRKITIANYLALALALAPALAPALAMAMASDAARPNASTDRFALFGEIELYAPGELAPPQWRRVLRRIGREGPTYARCATDRPACPSPRVHQWQMLVKELAGRPQREQLRSINRFANRTPYRSDRDNFGRSDYWATPLEFLAGAGDCEDYAILKYVSLRQLGFTAEQLEILVLQDVEQRVTHAVLIVAMDGKDYLLDNLTDDIRSETYFSQYLPLYWVTEPDVERLIAHDMTMTGRPAAIAGSGTAPR